VTGLTANTTYEFRLAAENSYGIGPYTANANVVTAHTYAVPD